MMNNFEIIQLVEQIVCPYFQFNIDDFYGDRGSCVYQKIEEMPTLFFKLKIIDKKIISRNKQQKLVDKIKNLNIVDTTIEIDSIPSFGRYIIIKSYKNT